MRLDHLLSKEHTPRPSPDRLVSPYLCGLCGGAWWCSLVESSMNDRPGFGSASVLPVAGLLFGVVLGWVWNVAGVGVGWLVGTLLSPEASAVRRVSLRGACVPRCLLGGCLLGVWGLRVVVSLVGWKFVNWIVDASILRHHFTRWCRDIAIGRSCACVCGRSLSSLCSFAL